MFDVQLSVYNKIVNNQATFCDFTILCIYPDTPRWKKYTRLPVKNSFAQVSGEVVGLYQVDRQLSLCLFISEFSLLSNISQTVSSPSSSATVSESPRNRLRRRGELPLQQTPMKKLQYNEDDGTSTVNAETSDQVLEDLSPQLSTRQGKRARK
jgi:hypothetical protein